MTGLILDLCAGAGGWEEGARTLGMTDTIGLELFHDPCRTALAAGHRRIRTDIATYPTAPFTGRVWGLVASPPCQAWSLAGKRGGERDRAACHDLVDRIAAGNVDNAGGAAGYRWADDRSALVTEPVRWVRDLRPEWVALEQVPPVLDLWRHIAHVLSGWGYRVWVGRLCAADYGVPQTRVRAILVASRTRRVGPPAATHHDPRGGLDALYGRPWVSMAEALGWTGIVDTGVNSEDSHGRHPYRRDTDQPAPTVTGHSGSQWQLIGQRRDAGPAAERAPRGLEEPSYTIRAEGSGTAPSGTEWVLDGAHRRKSGDRTRPRQLNQPAPTIAFGHSDMRWTSGESADRDNRVTVEQAAILQGFPADYPWQGGKTSRYLQVGNAIPPPLAAAVITAATGHQASEEVAA
jgi:DNA (cytosine-5)-methyltransferase 1